tara:strand:+ start:279 stop:458 length:180 start_codon:yes stop_codon:yes gene_type:complete
MKILLNVLWISLVMLVAGCGGSDSNVDVAGDLDQQAKANYEAEMKAQEAAETADMESAQ